MATKEYILSKFPPEFINKYDYSLVSAVHDTKEPITVICPVHGQFSQYIGNHKKSGCKKCNKEDTIRLKYIAIIRVMTDIHGGRFSYPEFVFKHQNQIIDIECKIHGMFKQKIYSHAIGQVGCKACVNKDHSDRLKDNTKSFIRKAKMVHGDRYDYSKVVHVGYKMPVDIGCQIHGMFSQTPGTHINDKSGCPQCSYLLTASKTRSDITKLIDEFNKVHDFKYDYSNMNYKNNREAFEVGCPDHGAFDITSSSHRLGAGCSSCFNKKNKAETAIEEFLIESGLNSDDIILHDRNVLNGKELDLYIPKCNIAIEYCGLYWHTERFLSDKNQHYDKFVKCKEQGIQLLTIFEDEWVDHQDQVKRKLLHLLNLSNEPVVYARKCVVSEIDSKTKKAFLNTNHIQGDGPGSINLGLYYQENLVAVMSFQNNTRYILNRYATSCRVVGGFTKLLAYFRKQNDDKGIVSFADQRWSDGALYANNGWILEKELAIDYSYLYNRERFHKFNFRRKNLQVLLGEKFDADKTEYENCLDNEIYRIWDCGKLRYSLM